MGFTPGGSDLQITGNVRTHLVRCLEKLPQKEEVFIMGDFNCNMRLSPKIKDFCSSLSLKQLIMEPTLVLQRIVAH